MSSTTQIPVYGDVCVKTEQKIIGYRDLTAGELAEEEAFSSGVPTEFGVGLDFDDQVTAVTWQPPGAVIANPPGGDYEPPQPVLLPAAIWLFAGALALWMHLKHRGVR
jgi:hypothetical protein